MEIPEGKADVYADILQILAYRSGQVHTVSVRSLCRNYFPSRSEDFIRECVDDLHERDYPVLCPEGDVVMLDDKEAATELIVEIRQEVYGL